MIYLNREPVSVFKIDPDLVVDYKVICDEILVNIRRNLSRQLIFYKVYYDLQQMYNGFFSIFDKLLNNLYEDSSVFNKDVSDFKGLCNVLLKNSENIIPENIHNLVDSDIKKLLLTIDKLVYIINNYCDFSEDSF
jgi:hypothetical protein